MKANSLKPFFCYYGGKWRAAPRYPKPSHNTLIEPFAGGAGYSLRNFRLDVNLYEIDPTIFSIWEYLTKVSAEEILSLPEKVETIDDVTAAQEAKWLIGFWLNKATTQPCKSASSWAKSGVRPNSHWGTVVRQRIASQLQYIRHWKVNNSSYADVPNADATWFIDPPYHNAVGRHFEVPHPWGFLIHRGNLC